MSKMLSLDAGEALHDKAGVPRAGIGCGASAIRRLRASGGAQPCPAWIENSLDAADVTLASNGEEMA